MALPNDLYLQATAGGATTDIQPSGTAAKGTSRYLAKLDHVHPATNSIANDFAAGTAAAPGFAVSTDTDTGLYQAVVNTVSFSAGGKESLRALAGSGTVVNYVTTAGSATGVQVGIAGAGTDTDIGINIAPKGAGVTTFGTAGSTNATIALSGSTSGTTVVAATAAASGTLTLPAVTDTLVGKATTDTLTNKTLTSPTVNGGTITGATISGTISSNTVKTSGSVTANGTSTYADVTGLIQTVVPGTYEFVAYLPSTVASGTGGIKYAFHYVTTVVSSIEATGRGYTASAVAVQHTTTTTDVADLFTQAAVVIFTEITGTMVVGTGGTVQLQMAQNTSNGSNSIALIGGSMQFKRIA